MRLINTAIIILTLTVFYSCKSKNPENKEADTPEPNVQIQGHRGDRGNFPENSIPAFKSAVKKGVDVIELDVVISKDKKVVVSHEPFMSSLFVNTASGDSIKKVEERSYNLYEMSYDSIRQFDVGSRGNKLFPHQQKMKTYKPLLSEIIDSIQNFIEDKRLPNVKYNIELKSIEAEYGKFQPRPAEFVELVMNVIKEKEMMNKIIIQSFDPNILNLMEEKHPQIPLAFLVYKEGIDYNLSLLNFIPDIYSPNFNLVKNQHFVDSVKSLHMELIPWTVNKKEDIQRMIELKANGIISDYPELVKEVINNSN